MISVTDKESTLGEEEAITLEISLRIYGMALGRCTGRLNHIIRDSGSKGPKTGTAKYGKATN